VSAYDDMLNSIKGEPASEMASKFDKAVKELPEILTYYFIENGIHGQVSKLAMACVLARINVKGYTHHVEKEGRKPDLNEACEAYDHLALFAKAATRTLFEGKEPSFHDAVRTALSPKLKRLPVESEALLDTPDGGTEVLSVSMSKRSNKVMIGLFENIDAVQLARAFSEAISQFGVALSLLYTESRDDAEFISEDLLKSIAVWLWHFNDEDREHPNGVWSRLHRARYDRSHMSVTDNRQSKE
jgi:hypothetical protein